MTEHIWGEARIRVRYAETDQMGVVYHANYLVWLEVGRVELMREMGLDYKALEQDYGVLIAVVEVNIRYKAPARYDDEILIQTHVLQVRSPIIRMGYKVCRASDGLLLCEASTTHVVVDREMKRAQLPAPYLAAFQQSMEREKATPTR